MILYIFILQLPLNSILYIYLNDKHLEWYKKKSFVISLIIAFSLELATNQFLSLGRFSDLKTFAFYLLGNLGYILISTPIIILTQYLINKWIMNSTNKKSKWAAWIIGIQCLAIVFFLLFAIVAKQDADRNKDLAIFNEMKVKRLEKSIQIEKKSALKERELANESLKLALKEKDVSEEHRRLSEMYKIKAMKCCGR